MHLARELNYISHPEERESRPTDRSLTQTDRSLVQHPHIRILD